MSKLNYIELSNNPSQWQFEADLAFSQCKLLLVHPGHILSLMESADAAFLERDEMEHLLDNFNRMAKKLEKMLDKTEK